MTKLMLIFIFLGSFGILPLTHSLIDHPPSSTFFGDELFSSIGNKSFASLAEALADGERYLLRQKETSNWPSLAFAISVKGKTVYEKAWGYSDLENSVPATPTTKYRLASVSKTFASVIVGTLVDKGLLKYDDLISKYLPNSVFPTKSWNGKQVNITLAQLLSHTAGTYASDVTIDFDTIQPSLNVTQIPLP